MIDLYYWTTSNGHKITIFLEETGLPYTIRPVNISRGDQFDSEFLKISPNNRIPAIVDHGPPDGGPPLSLFESGAILLYLAGKTGRYYPPDLRGRCEVAPATAAPRDEPGSTIPIALAATHRGRGCRSGYTGSRTRAARFPPGRGAACR